MLNAFDLQFADIYMTSPFSESATITLSDGYVYNVSGLFISGTFGQSSPMDSVAKTYEGREFYWVASAFFGEDYDSLIQKLNGAKVYIPTRGTFLVKDTRGERSGTLQLALNRMKKNGRTTKS